MSVSLEPVVPQEEPAPHVEIEEPPAPQEEEPPHEEEPPIVEESIEPPAPKRRGRPKKDPAAKAKAAAPKRAVKMNPPQPLTPESSGDEPTDRDDMETLWLRYLIKRKQTQQDARRNMWAQLVGLR